MNGSLVAALIPPSPRLHRIHSGKNVRIHSNSYSSNRGSTEVAHRMAAHAVSRAPKFVRCPCISRTIPCLTVPALRIKYDDVKVDGYVCDHADCGGGCGPRGRLRLTPHVLRREPSVNNKLLLESCKVKHVVNSGGAGWPEIYRGDVARRQYFSARVGSTRPGRKNALNDWMKGRRKGSRARLWQ